MDVAATWGSGLWDSNSATDRVFLAEGNATGYAGAALLGRSRLSGDGPRCLNIQITINDIG